MKKAEESINKTKLKRKYVRRFVFFMLAFIITFTLSIITAKISFKREEDKLVKYSEKSNLDYKVYLLENDFYETDYLGKNMLYVSNLIDKIVIDFNYDFISEENESIDFEYYVVGNLSISDNTAHKAYFLKNYTLLDKKTVNLVDSTTRNIKEQITIDYPHYNALANNFRNQYGLDADCKLSVNLFINKINKNDNEVMDSVSKMNIDIPLTQRAVNIALDYKEINDTGSIIVKSSVATKDILKIALTILFIILTPIMFIKVIKYLKLIIKRKSAYDKYVNRLLKEYDRLIAESTSLLSFEDKEKIKIEKFTELLDIHDNLQVPIMYYSVKEHEECYFYISYNNVIYLHTVNAKELELKNEKRN